MKVLAVLASTGLCFLLLQIQVSHWRVYRTRPRVGFTKQSFLLVSAKVSIQFALAKRGLLFPSSQKGFLKTRLIVGWGKTKRPILQCKSRFPIGLCKTGLPIDQCKTRLANGSWKTRTLYWLVQNKASSQFLQNGAALCFPFRIYLFLCPPRNTHHRGAVLRRLAEALHKTPFFCISLQGGCKWKHDCRAAALDVTGGSPNLFWLALLYASSGYISHAGNYAFWLEMRKFEMWKAHCWLQGAGMNGEARVPPEPARLSGFGRGCCLILTPY